jgi:hypothetical protein
MQLFLGITMSELADAMARGEFGPPPVPAYGVLPMQQPPAGQTREAIVQHAVASASRASLRKIAADPKAPRRRVVVEASVIDSSVTDNPVAGATSVILVEVLTVPDVVSVYADEPEVAGIVRDAANSLGDADAGSAKAMSIVADVSARRLRPHRGEEIPTLVA